MVLQVTMLGVIYQLLMNKGELYYSTTRKCSTYPPINRLLIVILATQVN